jgi:Tol biopolymer transport system component
MAEIGERVMERQLTFESMRVISFDVSPDETHIAYIPYQLEPLNSLVKMVEIASGETRVVLGENDPFSETSVVWIDDARMAYKSQDHLVPTFTTGQVDNPTTYIVYDLSTGKRIETTPFDLIVPSPDGRFWLTCIGHVEGCHTFSLRDVESGQEYPIGKSLKWVTFARWSPDSKHMVFHTIDSPDDCTGQIVLINAETLEERLVAPDDKDAWDAEVSPSGEFLVYRQSDIIDDGICKQGALYYWLMNMNTFEVEKIPAEFEKNVWNVNWSPDGRRLIFFYGSYAGREHDLWSMNLDGTDLRPMLPDVEEFKILPSRP